MVPNIISAFEMSELPSREEFKVLVQKANIGQSYLRAREDIEQEYHERRGKLYTDEPETFGERK
jgi:hypothetical protein